MHFSAAIPLAHSLILLRTRREGGSRHETGESNLAVGRIRAEHGIACRIAFQSLPRDVSYVETVQARSGSPIARSSSSRSRVNVLEGTVEKVDQRLGPSRLDLASAEW